MYISLVHNVSTVVPMYIINVTKILIWNELV